ncbi:MAG: GNAT family N-acetyltransferase, partial [Bacteroidota bacterium]|nr:GNAT family N-acetyltransferase [Bacteroidota bacterium]
MNDLPALQNLYVQTIENTCQNDYDANQLKVWKLSVENKESWTNALQTQYFLVAEIDDQIVGFGSLKDG